MFKMIEWDETNYHECKSHIELDIQQGTEISLIPKNSHWYIIRKQAMSFLKEETAFFLWACGYPGPFVSKEVAEKWIIWVKLNL